MKTRIAVIAAHALALAAPLYLAACTSTVYAPPEDPSQKAYVAPELHVSAEKAEIFASVVEYVSSLGWSIDHLDPTNGRIVARTELSDAGTRQRDTWTFDVKAGKVVVHDKLELGNIDGTNWVSSDKVCRSYAYAAEESHLGKIAGLLAAESGRKLSPRPEGAVAVAAR